jgi:hypothetical protein
MEEKKILIFCQLIKRVLTKEQSWIPKHQIFEVKTNDVFEWGILDNGGNT